MHGFVKSYFNQQHNVNHSHQIMNYFTPEKLPVLYDAGDELRGVQPLVCVHPGAHAVQPRVCALWHVVRPGQHGRLLLEQAVQEHL